MILDLFGLKLTKLLVPSSYVRELETELKNARITISGKVKLLHKKDQLISVLRNKIVQLEDSLKELDLDLHNCIIKMFSPKQIQRLKSKESIVHWDESDISKGIALDSISAKCYN